MYSIKNINNFAILDSPGDSENDAYFQFFLSKGYLYSKMIIYIIDERIPLDADSMRNNKNLETLINLRNNYKIPLLILLTHSDNFCNEILLENKNNWKNICSRGIISNTINLLSYINNSMTDSVIKEEDIMHIVLSENNEMKKEEKIKNLDEETKKDYDEADEKGKEVILRCFFRGKESNNKIIEKFLDNEIGILRKDLLIKEIKNRIPCQYHAALSS